MDSVESLKNDIIKTNIVVKEEQRELKKKIDGGWLNDMDLFYENPQNKDYYIKAMNEIQKEQERKNLVCYGNEGFWKKIKNNIIKIIKGNESE